MPNVVVKETNWLGTGLPALSITVAAMLDLDWSPIVPARIVVGFAVTVTVVEPVISTASKGIVCPNAAPSLKKPVKVRKFMQV